MSTSLTHNTQNGNDNNDIAVQDVTATSESTLLPQEKLFYYRPNNDFQIYLVYCKEITLNELTVELLNNYFYSSYNYLYSNKIFVFYFKHPYDLKIYHVACEMISHSAIVQHLNLNVCGLELSQSDQQQQQPLEFTSDHKYNLEFHLRRSLVNDLAPKE
ncbi:10478_t:CDS:1 [Funneliformis geosporum]|uniref:3319_t:CDS:1 n=1 Tax=Funneliformis geosporum TaxID=1117311 RepID=A0A9W4SHY8_9GLOM|nr:10478_t:CDS:1 [Funneliformis geosporum]CAI2170386.1 3319_t:CDS:1 [Funneliformis geosporum]